MVRDNAQPIIIKKIRKGGHGHHGGAWKVAFADFVTAMMAFFLLLWLLGSTTEEQKRGISDYFENPAGPPANGGASTAVIDMGGGMDAPTGGGNDPSLNPPEGPSGDDRGGKATLDDLALDEAAIEAQAKALELEQLEDLKERLAELMEQSAALAQFKDQILLDITSEGLRIQIVDEENRPMFDVGSASLKGYTQEILREVGKAVGSMPNRISLSGHTDRRPYTRSDGYSNWELSADRANAARRELVAAGLPEDKVGRVVGLASSVLFAPEEPLNPINRRISIIVMNKATEASIEDSESASPGAQRAAVESGPPAPAPAPAPGEVPPGPAGDTAAGPPAEPAPVTPPALAGTPPIADAR